MQWYTLDSSLLQGEVLVWPVCQPVVHFVVLNKVVWIKGLSLSLLFFTGQVTENNRCSVSPASAFAIATAAAGHSSPPGRDRWWSQNHCIYLCPILFSVCFFVFVFHYLLSCFVFFPVYITSSWNFWLCFPLLLSNFQRSITLPVFLIQFSTIQKGRATKSSSLGEQPPTEFWMSFVTGSPSTHRYLWRETPTVGLGSLSVISRVQLLQVCFTHIKVLVLQQCMKPWMTFCASAQLEAKFRFGVKTAQST